MSQFDANFEIKFLVVYRGQHLYSKKKPVFLKIRYSDNLLHNICHNFHLFTRVWSRILISHSIITYQSTGRSKLVLKLFVSQHESSVAIKYHVIKRPTRSILNVKNYSILSKDGGSSIFLEKEQQSCLFLPRFQANK